MVRIMRSLVLVLLALSVSSSPGSASNDAKNASSYFGHIDTIATTDVEAFRSELRDLACCTTINTKCDAGTNILRALFGGTLRERLPDFIVYIERKDGTLAAHRPVLMWNGRNTPHLYGARYIYVLVFSDQRIPLVASATTEFHRASNPFLGLLAILGAPSKEPEAGDDPVSSAANVSWEPLTGDEKQPGLWAGYARLPIKLNSVNRVTVAFRQPVQTFTVNEVATRGAESVEIKTVDGNDKTTVTTTLTTTRNGAAAVEARETVHDETNKTTVQDKTTSTTTEPHMKTQAVVKNETTQARPHTTTTTTRAEPTHATTITTKSEITGPGPLSDTWPATDFRAASGHFSNARSSLAAFSVAIASTFNTGGTAVSKEEGDKHFNGYAMAKFYLPRLRPRLSVGPERKKLYRPSFGFVVGTNVTEGAFDEIVVGVSAGHLVGSAGIVAAANRIAGDTDAKQKWRFLVGVDYTF